MFRHTVACITLALSVGCGGSAPTSPTPTVVSLAIDPVPREIGVGTSMQLAAQARYSNGSLETTTVTWSVTPNSVATITSTGQVFGVRLGLATILAAHTSGLTAAAQVEVVANPSIPLSPASEMSGLWAGDYTLDVCRRVSGDGPEKCRFLLGSRRPAALQISQTGTRLDGQLTLDSSLVGAVSGWRDAFGFHVLFGTLSGQGELVGFTVELTKWDAKTTIATNSLTGTFEGIERSTSAVAGAQVYVVGGTFNDMKR